jgi:hypothetical protein
MATALLITRDDLVRFTAVNGNVDTDKFITVCQNRSGHSHSKLLRHEITSEDSSGYHRRYSFR